MTSGRLLQVQHDAGTGAHAALRHAIVPAWLGRRPSSYGKPSEAGETAPEAACAAASAAAVRCGQGGCEQQFYVQAGCSVVACPRCGAHHTPEPAATDATREIGRAHV